MIKAISWSPRAGRRTRSAWRRSTRNHASFWTCLRIPTLMTQWSGSGNTGFGFSTWPVPADRAIPRFTPPHAASFGRYSSLRADQLRERRHDPDLDLFAVFTRCVPDYPDSPTPSAARIRQTVESLTSGVIFATSRAILFMMAGQKNGEWRGLLGNHREWGSWTLLNS